MPRSPDALKYLAPNWFTLVMGLTGLSLAWGQAAPLMGDMATAGALVLGLCFITEGAIPFAARDPMRVLPCCIVGGAITGALSMAVGAKLMAPHGGLFVLLIPGAITPVVGYLLAIIAGTLVAGLSYAVLKRPEAEVVAKAA